MIDGLRQQQPKQKPQHQQILTVSGLSDLTRSKKQRLMTCGQVSHTYTHPLAHTSHADGRRAIFACSFCSDRSDNAFTFWITDYHTSIRGEYYSYAYMCLYRDNFAQDYDGIRTSQNAQSNGHKIIITLCVEASCGRASVCLSMAPFNYAKNNKWNAYAIRIRMNECRYCISCPFHLCLRRHRRFAVNKTKITILLLLILPRLTRISQRVSVHFFSHNSYYYLNRCIK